MLQKQITNRILTVGINYKKPRGGIAQVLSVYRKFFETFPFVATAAHGDSSKIVKGLVFAVALLKIEKKLQNKKIEVVHIHSSIDASFSRKKLIVALAKKHKKKVIFHIHSGNFKAYAKKHEADVRKVLERVDAVVALSDKWKSYFESNFNCRNVQVIHNPLCIPKNPAPMSVDENAPLKMLFLGKIADHKGIFELLEVMRRNRQEWNGRLHLTVGGNGETDRLERTVAEYGLSEMVRFVGWIDGKAKEREFLASDLFILPSHYEGLPVCLLESLGYERPVIATPVGGVPEIINTDPQAPNGFLFTPGDLDGMEAAIRRALDTPRPELKAMGQSSAALLESYSTTHVEASLRKLYTALLSKKK